MTVEREGLEKKEKSELQTIITALGGSSTSRAKKADLIDQILQMTGRAEADHPVGPDGEPLADWEVEVMGDGTRSGAKRSESASGGGTDASGDASSDAGSDSTAPSGRGSGPRDSSDKSTESKHAGSNDAGSKDSGSKDAGSKDAGSKDAGSKDAGSKDAGSKDAGSKDAGSKDAGSKNSGSRDGGSKDGRRDRGRDRDGDRGKDNDSKGSGKGNDDVESGNRRNRRRGKVRGRDRDDAGNDAVSDELVSIDGFVDLRDEGYAFLRANGFLPSRDDAYVSVKQVRQFGLRKGDHLIGSCRPANRNEKNPALSEITSINGLDPSEMGPRRDFESLTPLFPDERLVLESKDEPLNMTTRIIDLLSPIGKGQRGLIVSPPKAGKTSIMKNIARAIETNNPEVNLLVLLVDERPEEVTDMKRSLGRGEVVASTFDRPPEEHTAVAELTLERAKRMAENGTDVCLIIDGITRLARAYNMSGPQTGKAMSGGIDAAALYPPKRFLGAARNFEEGGSLTILATALVETGSRMDEVIFEECKGTGNMELRLDRRLAEKRIFPAIDIDGSSTRNEELLRSRKEVEASWKLRRVVAGLSAGDDSSNAVGVEMLVERLATFKTNEEFLAEIARAKAD